MKEKIKNWIIFLYVLISLGTISFVWVKGWPEFMGMEAYVYCLPFVPGIFLFGIMILMVLVRVDD